MAKVIVKNDDGNVQEVNLPDFALESTLQKLVTAMAGISGINEETKKALEDLGKKTQEGLSDEQKNEKTRQQQANEALDALKTVNKSIKEGNKQKEKDEGILKEAFSEASSMLKGVFVAGLSAVGTGLYNLVTTAYDVGNAFRDLNQQGILLGTDLRDNLSPTDALAAFTQLGMNASQAGQFLGNYSQLVATQGVGAMRASALMLGSVTKNGSQFGMTMSELTEVVGDELALRQMMGVINTRNDMKAMASSKLLMDRQLAMSQILGKSIKDLKAASDNTLQNPMFQATMAGLDVAGRDVDGLTTAMREAQSMMLNMGFDQKIIDQMGNEMVDVVAFMSDAGLDLLSAFGATGAEGAEVTSTLSRINNLIREGTDASIKEASEQMRNLPNQMRDAIGTMDKKEIDAFKSVAQSVGGQMGEALMTSLNGVRLYNQRIEELQNTAGGTDLATKFNEMARGAAAFDQARNSMKGSLDTLRMGFAGTLAPAMGIFTQVLNSFTSVFLERGGEINKAISKVAEALGINLKDGAVDLGDAIKDKLLPKFHKFITYIVNFINSLGDTGKKDKDGKMITGLDLMIDGLVTAGATLLAFVDGLTTVIGYITSFFSASLFSDMEDGIFKSVLQSVEFIGKAFVAAMAVGLAKAGIGKLVGMLIPGGGAGGAAGAVGKGVGKGAATLGTGLGKGAGGLLKGLSSGLTAMGGLKVFAGIAALTALGASMFVIAPGFAKFADVNWETMGKAIVGLAGLGAVAAVLGMFAGPALLGAAALGAIGLALHLFPVDALEAVGTALESAFNGIATVITSVFSGIGEIIGKASEAINSFKLAGAEAENMRLEGATKAVKELAGIDESRFPAISAGIDSIAASLLNFSNSVGDNGFFGFGASGADVDKQMEQVGVFNLFAELDAVAIQASADALSSMVDVYTRFGGLDNTAIMNTAGAIKELNNSVTNEQSLGEMVVSTGKSILDFGMNLLTGGSDTPSTEAMTTASTDDTASGGKSDTKMQITAVIDNDQMSRLERQLKQINEKTTA